MVVTLLNLKNAFRYFDYLMLKTVLKDHYTVKWITTVLNINLQNYDASVGPESIVYHQPTVIIL